MARVVILSATNYTFALNSLQWLSIQPRLYFKSAYLVRHFLHNACSRCLSSVIHSYSLSRQLHCASLNRLSEPCINSTLLLPLVVFNMLALLFEITSLFTNTNTYKNKNEYGVPYNSNRPAAPYNTHG